MGDWIPNFIKDLWSAMFDRARELGAGLVGRILTGLGLGFGFQNYTLPSITGFLQAKFPPSADVVNLLAHISVFKAISMIVTAYTVRAGAKVFMRVLNPSSIVGSGS